MKGHYERLSQMDNSFLVYESAQTAMHVGSTQVHEAKPLRCSDGTLDIERLQDYVVSRLDRIPRYRQRLAYTPLEGHPVWIDDPDFNVHYHVRHSRLPRPGDERQLKRMIGRILSHPLDRGKPLWEMWVIEGLESDRVAIVSKVHHCMVDGVSGAELLRTLLTTEPVDKVDPPGVWRPRPVPTRLQLGRGELSRAIRAPLIAGAALARLALDERDARRRLGERMRAVGRVIGGALERTSALPFNQPIGPHRRIDWTTMPLERLGAVRRVLGGTLNDIVLAISAGAMGRYLSDSRGLDVDDLHFRVMTPVSVRRATEKGAMGNQIAAWTLELPIAEADPLRRLEEIRRATDERKRKKDALGVETVAQLTEWTGSGLLSMGARLMHRSTPFNAVITNVPGSPVRLYLLDSPLLEIHPHVPLVGTLGLGVALFSYAGVLSWGFTSDWDLVPDLHDLVCATDRAFEEICEAAGV